MLVILENIIARLLLAIVPTALWTIASFIITHGLYEIKGKEVPQNYGDDFSYTYVTNYILIFLCLIFFYRENIALF